MDLSNMIVPLRRRQETRCVAKLRRRYASKAVEKRLRNAQLGLRGEWRCWCRAGLKGLYLIQDREHASCLRIAKGLIGRPEPRRRRPEESPQGNCQQHPADPFPTDVLPLGHSLFAFLLLACSFVGSASEARSYPSKRMLPQSRV